MDDNEGCFVLVAIVVLIFLGMLIGAAGDTHKQNAIDCAHRLSAAHTTSDTLKIATTNECRWWVEAMRTTPGGTTP